MTKPNIYDDENRAHIDLFERQRGTPLSRSFTDQTLTFSHYGASRSIPLFRGASVSCFFCHKRENDGSLGGVFTNNGRPAVTNTPLTTQTNTPRSLTLGSSDPNNNTRTLRIVSQPQHGTVALAGDINGTRYWTFGTSRAPAPGDVSTHVEFSSDLMNWVRGVEVSNTPFLLEVRDPIPADGQPKRFTRIGASR